MLACSVARETLISSLAATEGVDFWRTLTRWGTSMYSYAELLILVGTLAALISAVALVAIALAMG
jgi:hypothetical protein